MRRLSLALLMASCGDGPSTCERTCDLALAALTDCISQQGHTWPELGYADAEDFQGACETWRWTRTLRAREAGDLGALEQTCIEHNAVLREPGACEGFEAVPWETP